MLHVVRCLRSVKNSIFFSFLQYVVPWLVNQMGSLVYLFAIQRVPLSLAMPAANSLAFAFTALTGSLVGTERPLDQGMLY